MRPRVCLLGLDGATWDVIDPLVAEGRLPTLARLREQGAGAVLETTFPPMTGPAWVSLATGLNPGKTGVFDFLNRSGPGFEFHPVSSRYLAGRAFWDLLGDRGHRVAVLNYPVAYPPYRVNGCLVAGLLSPEGASLTYPAGLQSELDRAAGGYQVLVPYGEPRYADREQSFVSDVTTLIAKRRKALRHLWSLEPWDVLVVVLSAPDLIQHYLWKHWDRDSGGGRSRSESIRREFCRLWSMVDEQVGEIIELVGPAGNTLIVSDHGFGLQEGVFYVNRWLEEEGYLVRRQRTLKRRLLDRMGAAAWRVDRLAGTGLFNWGTRATAHMRGSYADQFDLGRSAAVAGQLSDVSGGIFLLEGDDRTDTGIRKLREELVEKLNRLPARLPGITEAEVHVREELYEGPYVDRAPHISFALNGFACSIRLEFPEDGRVFREGVYAASKSGAHRREGILLAVGPGIRHCNLDRASIYDISPTVLSLMDHPLPPGLDGAPLAGALARSPSARAPRRS